ncbi:MAG: ImmA/IrrE family metallo-endopeptidase, partial [Gemmatimonadales bacterium]
LLYSPTPNSRRQNFTILHELAHWLISREKDIVVWAADQEGSDQLLETMCDHIAQQLLLSDESVGIVVGQGPVTRRSG